MTVPSLYKTQRVPDSGRKINIEENLVGKFVEVVEDSLTNNKPMMTWDEFYDLCEVPASDRTDIGTAAILNQATPVLREKGYNV
jgi:hypothetical protein